MKQQPSDLFVAAILRAYRKESGPQVTPADIWDQIVMECVPRLGAFEEMFAWDTRPGKRNRIETIRECIAAGLVPGLRLATNARGRQIVEEAS